MQNKIEGKAPKVSVIIPCYNAGNTIAECLKGVLAQKYPSYEIIAVDDNSKDDTAKILKAISGIKVIFNNANYGPAYSRNEAIKVSTGEIIIMFDSDSLIDDEDVILKHVLAHQSPLVHILGGGIQGIGRGPIAKADNYSHWFLNIPYSSNKITTHIVTNNMSVKKCVFEKIGYFNDSLRTGEDTDYCERAIKADYNLNLKTDIVIKHHDREKIKDFLKCFYLVGIDRIPARRSSKHRYWYLLPFDFFSSLVYCFPLSLLLTAQIILAWLRYDKRVILYSPLLYLSRLSMSIGIVHYYFFNNFLIKRYRKQRKK